MEKDLLPDFFLCSRKSFYKNMLDLRNEVFVVEQNIPVELVVDDDDKKAFHIVAVFSGLVIGCGRVVINDFFSKIGRVAVKKKYRNKGVGKKIIIKLIDISIKNGCEKVILNSQVESLKFYEKIGFKKNGSYFYIAGIKHVPMVYDL